MKRGPRVDSEPQCVAARTVKTWNRFEAGPRCRVVGRIRTAHGLVCAQHNRFGFIPFVEEPVDAEMALRARAVLDDAA